MRSSWWVLVLLVAPMAAAANDWSQFKYDETHQGAVPTGANGEFGPFKESWWHGVAVPPNPGSLTVRDGLVYVGDSNGIIHAYDQESGGQVWSNTTVAAAKIVGAPAVGQNLVYVLTDSGALYMFDRKTGQSLGTITAGPSETSPVLSETGGLLILAGGSSVNGYLLGAKGIVQSTPKWTFNVAGSFFNNNLTCTATPNQVTTPLVWATTTSTQVMFGSVNKCFYSIDATSVGPITAPLWGFKAANSIRSPPGVDAVNSKVVFGDSGGSVYILPLAATGLVTGAAAFTEPTTGKINEIVASPVVAYGKILVGSRNGNLRVLSSTGSPEQLRNLGDQQIVATPAVANNQILAGSFDGNVYLLKFGDLSNAQDPIRTAGQVESSPAISGTQGFWASTDGTLYSYGGTKPDRADLAVENLAAPGLVAGRPGTVTATIHNIGKLASTATKVKLLVAGVSVVEQDLPALDAGATAPFSASYTPATPGPLAIRLFADSQRSVKESDESNNDVTITVTVAPPAPPPTATSSAGTSDTKEKGIPGFEAAFLSVALAGAAVAARRRR